MAGAPSLTSTKNDDCRRLLRPVNVSPFALVVSPRFAGMASAPSPDGCVVECGARTSSSSMLMVIFGAGASYDSDPTRPSANYVLPTPHRPPLANQLFDNRPEFAHDLSYFPECIPIVPLLRHADAIE